MRVANRSGARLLLAGKLYFQNHAGEEFKVLHRVAMGDAGDRDTRATIAVSGGNLFIRTASKLYCVGK